MLIRTQDLTEDNIRPLAGFKLDQIYNGLDCMVMLEVLEEISKLTNKSPEIYDFERALQAPALEMMLRGFLVDQQEKQRCISELRDNIKFLDGRLQRLANAVWGAPLNPRSPPQCIEFFYRYLKIPPIFKWEGGIKKTPMDRETLEKLEEHYHAAPIVSLIMQIREDERSLKVLETEIDFDGRFRTSYNIAATKTHRWSSSKSAEGTGGNQQNWKERLRRVMMADPGWKLGAIDLEQSDARELGFTIGVLFDDWTYLDNCEAGDLHTSSSRLIWPELAWTGDLKKDRKIADTVFYRDLSYRYMAKKGGHAVNYIAQPRTVSRHLKIALRVADVFQQRYFAAYKAIPRFHLWCAGELERTHQLRTYWGNVRHFFGRANDDSTLREAVAHMGQSPTALRMSYGVYRLWEQMRQRIRLVAQVHDAVYFLYREDDDEVDVLRNAVRCVEIPVKAPSGRVFQIPGEAKVGWNWSQKHDEGKPCDVKTNPYNPNGLVKFRGARDERKREDHF